MGVAQKVAPGRGLFDDDTCKDHIEINIIQMCSILERPSSPLEGGPTIQARKPADGYGKPELHIGKSLILKIRRVSITGPSQF